MFIMSKFFNRLGHLFLLLPVHYFNYFVIIFLLIFIPTFSYAQDYPVKSVKLIVPYTPGGATDLVGRLVAKELSRISGQNFIVENKPGAGSLIGADFVAKAAPDGYTLGFLTGAAVVNIPLVKLDVRYETERDLIPVSLVQTTSQLLVARPDFPANSIIEVLNLARSGVDKVSYAHTGTGTANHLAGLALNSMGNVRLLLVAYPGEQPFLNELMAGRIDIGVATVQVAAELIKAGKIKLIASVGKKRALAFPDVKTVEESGFPSFFGDSFMGIHVPAGTSTEIISYISKSVATALAQPAIREKIIQQGGIPIGSTSEEYVHFLNEERRRSSKLITDAKIKKE